MRFLYILLISLSLIQNSHADTDTILLPKWQLGIGIFSGSVPHYPASNHIYQLTSPAPVFVYRFKDVTINRRTISIPINDQLSFGIAFGFSPPVGKNNRSAEDFPNNSNNPNKKIITEDNFHRRGMDALPAIFKTGTQISYQPFKNFELKLPLLFNLGVNDFDYQGYEMHPEISLSLNPLGARVGENDFNIIGSVTMRYGDKTINKAYYQVNKSDAIDGRPAYNAQAGEISRSYRIRLSYQHKFNYNNSILFFLSIRRLNYSHSANTASPLHITNSHNTIATGLAYYFYSSKKTVSR
jgi:hypothetical protein